MATYKKWKRISEKTVYKGRVDILEYDVELPDGSSSKYEVVHGATQPAAVLVKTAKNETILSYEYRFPQIHRHQSLFPLTAHTLQHQ